MSAADFSVTGGDNRTPFNFEKVEQTSRDVTTTWIPISDVADQLNLYGDTSQNTLLINLELSARMFIEDYLNISVFPTGYRVYYKQSVLIGPNVELDIPQSGGISIGSVKYWNSSNVLTTVDPSVYYFDASGNKIVLTSAPVDVSSFRSNPIYADYTLQASPLANYPVIQQASLLMVMHLYNNRSETHDKKLYRIPMGVDSLLRPYKDLVL